MKHLWAERRERSRVTIGEVTKVTPSRFWESLTISRSDELAATSSVSAALYPTRPVSQTADKQDGKVYVKTQASKRDKEENVSHAPQTH